MDYREFLDKKLFEYKPCGFQVSTDDLNPMLFDWQKMLVRWALYKGRAALFEDCGLGKTPQQLEWAYRVHLHTGGKVLIYAPLAVSQQTVREGRKFGIKVHRCADQEDVIDGINITNYERLDKFDPATFVGIVLDECFPPDTPIEVLSIDKSLELRHIKNIREGDTIINAQGEDHVKQTYKRRINRAVQVGAGQHKIICSENHPFFTVHGWRCAQDLQPGDYIMETAEAMRLLRGYFCSGIPRPEVAEVLRSILLSEMEDEYPGTQGEGPHSGDCREAGVEKERMVSKRRSCCEKRIGENPHTKPHVESRNKEEGFSYIAEDGAQTFRAWGEWEWFDGPAADFIGCSWERLDSGICFIVGPTDSGISIRLQARLGRSRKENKYRSGRSIPLQPEGGRPKEGHQNGFVRVDSVEVLEQGHPELEKYRDGEGHIYFYDIKAARHPSFSVGGLLVHNSSIIKDFTGKFRNKLIEAYASVPYKLACSATPSPNDYTELGNTAEFLGVMSRSEMLSMFFINDSGDTTASWRLKGHVADNKFWEWLSAWCVVLQKPSDLGFEDAGFILPPLNIHEHVIPADGNGWFVEPAEGLSGIRESMRETMDERCQIAADIVNGSDNQWCVWCSLNPESELLTKMINGAVEVKGADAPEHKETSLLAFAEGEINRLVTKPKIAMWGLNFQNCSHSVVTGLSHSYEQFYQLVRRFYRFGQSMPVNIHIVIGEREMGVLDAIKRKEKQMADMFAGMVRHMQKLTIQELQHTSRKTTPYRPAMEMVLPKFLEVA